MTGIHKSFPKVLASLIVMAVASPALAQAPRSGFDVIMSNGVPEFRDPRTGKVWTPDIVGQDGKPVAPDDRAFDPFAQVVAVEGVIEQQVRGRPVGTVPITAGPTVPLVDIEAASLRALPGQRWQLVLYLNNNSASPVSPVIDCDFTNAGKKVSETRAHVSQTAPGMRVGLVIYGPRTDVFVDHAACRVLSP
jgi:hypothetical protein